MKKTLYELAATCQKTPRPPVWMMRQAGRYLPEYRQIREKYSFIEMIKTPKIAAEITLQPIHRFGMDAAILFSDILVTAEALGCHVDIIEKKGPIITPPIRTRADVDTLNTVNTTKKLTYVLEAIDLLTPQVTALNIPLIGFAGAPFTVASYMIEGQSSPDLKLTKQLMTQDPSTLHALLEKLTNVTIDYLNAQLKAGVKALQIFDTWAGHLSYTDFETYSSTYIQKIIQNLNNPNNCPITVFAKNTTTFAPLLTTTGANVISVDWQTNLKTLKNIVPQNMAIQGNLDPYLLFAPDDILTQRVDAILNTMQDRPGYIFNLGHGLMPDINPEKVALVVNRVQAFHH
ncbi:MAG: uroporphyrinogen decarboxylase [Candidatus Margulisbacteria bacterium]|nr:uroporphyrinogen decarboxylase [Candidatus Margulisiibacteriota bacterium]